MDVILFELKKFITALLMPELIILMLGIAGLVLLNRRASKGWGVATIGLALSLLALGSLRPVADAIAKPLESDFAAYDGSRPAEYVVVLGAGHRSDPRVPVSSVLGSSGLFRLTEGIRVLNLNPGAQLLLSGYSRFDPKSTAEVYRDLAVALGVPADRILVEPRPKDTAEEAHYVKEAIGAAPFALVTSASHMPRAMALFRGAGLNPVAAPTDFMVKQSGERDWLDFVPNSIFLAQTRLAWHEWLGRLWAGLRGQTQAAD